MLKRFFPLSYPKKTVLGSAAAYFLIYFIGSFIKGAVVYLTELDLIGGIFGLAITVYVFIGLLLLCLDHLKLHKKP
ncbi:MAG: hypothetical protein J6Q56_00285 [Clostridia bacterium]|nr:hypothetical protein [Clostridia bacterium]